MTWDTQEQFIESYEEMRKREIREERAAYAKFNKMADVLIDFCRTNPYLSHHDWQGMLSMRYEQRFPTPPTRPDPRYLTAGHKQLHRLFERDGARCAYCGVALVCECNAPWDGKRRFAETDEMRYGVREHVLPASRGGTSLDDNLVPSCNPCNTRKGARTPVEWLGEGWRA